MAQEHAVEYIILIVECGVQEFSHGNLTLLSSGSLNRLARDGQ